MAVVIGFDFYLASELEDLFLTQPITEKHLHWLASEPYQRETLGPGITKVKFHFTIVSIWFKLGSGGEGLSSNEWTLVRWGQDFSYCSHVYFY